MSHRSAVIREQKKIVQPATFANKQRPPAVQLQTLIAFLLEQGMSPGYKIQFSKDAKLVRVLATCGPVEIPLDFSPAQARVFGSGVITAADTVDAAEETALKGDYDDDDDEDLSYTVAADACTDSPQ